MCIQNEKTFKNSFPANKVAEVLKTRCIDGQYRGMDLITVAIALDVPWTPDAFDYDISDLLQDLRKHKNIGKGNPYPLVYVPDNSTT